MSIDNLSMNIIATISVAITTYRILWTQIHMQTSSMSNQKKQGLLRSNPFVPKWNENRQPSYFEGCYVILLKIKKKKSYQCPFTHIESRAIYSLVKTKSIPIYTETMTTKSYEKECYDTKKKPKMWNIWLPL